MRRHGNSSPGAWATTGDFKSRPLPEARQLRDTARFGHEARTPGLRELALPAGCSLAIILLFRRFRPVGDLATISTLAEIGVVLLLFTVGLEFSIADLTKGTIEAVVLLHHSPVIGRTPPGEQSAGGEGCRAGGAPGGRARDDRLRPTAGAAGRGYARANREACAA